MGNRNKSRDYVSLFFLGFLGSLAVACILHYGMHLPPVWFAAVSVLEFPIFVTWIVKLRESKRDREKFVNEYYNYHTAFFQFLPREVVQSLVDKRLRELAILCENAQRRQSLVNDGGMVAFQKLQSDKPSYGLPGQVKNVTDAMRVMTQHFEECEQNFFKVAKDAKILNFDIAVKDDWMSYVRSTQVVKVG